MYNCYDQISAKGIADKKLPTYHISREVPVSNTTYSLTEKAYGHLNIRVSRGRDDFNKALNQLTGLNLPVEPLQSFSNDAFTIHWLSNDEYLLLTPEKSEFEIETRLRAQVTGHYAIVNVTSGQAVLELSGKRAESILRKSTSYDIHNDSLNIGKVVSTVFAKSQVVLWRRDVNQFSLVVRRSFSDYIWRWIVDAGARE